MSYILDALRKSDQQRQRGAAPTLLTTQATAEAPKRPAFLSYGALAAVLVSAGIMIGWLHPWQPEQPTSATEPMAAKPFESGQRPNAPAAHFVLPEMDAKTGPESLAQKPTSAARPAAEPAGAAIKQRVPALTTAETHGAARKAVAAIPKDARTAVPEKPAGTGPDTARQEPIAMTIAELPASIREEIPRMSISVHAYSPSPKDRIVGINDRLLREGGYLAPGLMLEQITPDGMIFSYKGYRFRQGLQGSAATAATR